MKWFKHSVHARSEHGTEDILRCQGPAGLGIYWCLLEMLARDTEQFRMRIAGISSEADERFEGERSRGLCPARHLYRIDLLAKTLNTEPDRIVDVISLGSSLGLFDRELWRLYSILHSPGFCDQADEYTRRLRRGPSRPEDGAIQEDPSTETLTETPESLRSCHDNPGPEEKREEENRREPPVLEAPLTSVKPSHPPPGGFGGNTAHDVDALLRRCTLLVADWNRRNRRAFELRLGRPGLRRLLGGDPRWRDRVSFETINLTHGGPTFEDVVLRGVWLMLEASRRSRIGDQFAWLWSCIHGTRGSPPWVHRLTAEEEHRPRLRQRAEAEGEFTTIAEFLAQRSSSEGGSCR